MTLLLIAGALLALWGIIAGVVYALCVSSGDNSRLEEADVDSPCQADSTT
jgi:hypothetical protein